MQKPLITLKLKLFQLECRVYGLSRRVDMETLTVLMNRKWALTFEDDIILQVERGELS